MPSLVDAFAMVHASKSHAERTLRLAPAAAAKAKALESDAKMAAVWKVISPGKKAAAAVLPAARARRALRTPCALRSPPQPRAPSQRRRLLACEPLSGGSGEGCSRVSH